MPNKISDSNDILEQLGKAGQFIAQEYSFEDELGSPRYWENPKASSCDIAIKEAITAINDLRHGNSTKDEIIKQQKQKIENLTTGEFAQSRGFEERGPQAIIKFADTDVMDMYFHDEYAIERATQVWYSRRMNWNCSLFVTPLISSLPPEDDEFISKHLDELHGKLDQISNN